MLGSGRSGTSMVAGSLQAAGYFLGDNLHPARLANPKGFFEDAEVNAVNEEMLSHVVPRRPRTPLVRTFFAGRPEFWQRWVATVPVGTPLPPLPATLAARRDALVDRAPFALKDPRFCYTLPYWRDAVGDARFVCVFREPGRTARSIATECATADYMRSLRFGGVSQALQVWTSMYEHVLRHASSGGDWLFVHYDQFLTGQGADALSAFLDAEVDRSFADPGLKRSPDDVDVPSRTHDVYRELCRRAGVMGAP